MRGRLCTEGSTAHQALLVYGFIFKVVLQCFVTFLQDFVNLKGEVFFPNLTFEMEKVRDKISGTRMCLPSYLLF